MKTLKDVVLRLALIAAILSPVYLTGCNTMRGAGEDIEEAGEEIQEEANEHDDGRR